MRLDNVKAHKEKGKTEVKKNVPKRTNNNIVFAFSFFNGKSIKLDSKEFNSHYATESDSKKAISDFFNTLKVISQMNYTNLCSPDNKEQLHYNEFTEGEEIDRIEIVLKEGYGFPQDKINEFERLYLELSFSNGKRVIGTKIGDNVIEILFIDTNHMICIDSCRNKKQKMMFEYPSLFSTYNLNDNYREYDKEELITMLIDDAEKGNYNDLKKFISDFKDILSYEEKNDTI